MALSLYVEDSFALKLRSTVNEVYLSFSLQGQYMIWAMFLKLVWG